MTRAAPRLPHLAAVGEAAAAFAPLVEVLRAAGMRVGWLAWRQPAAADAGLEAAAAAGMRRAVAAGGGRSVAVKPLAGAPVLRDLVREHFHGCTLVLVEGAPAAADLVRLAVCDGGWRIEAAGGPRDAASRQMDAAGLVAALRRPRPWAPPQAP